MHELRKRSLQVNVPDDTHPLRKDGYDPLWVVCDPKRVNLSRNMRLASCMSEIGGQTVLGTPLPMTGVSAFMMSIYRRDRTIGLPLGSGHFAGVAISSFSQRSPHFSELKHLNEPLWVIQDVQDGDSLPNQATLPPLPHGEKGNELFVCGTKLLFIVDRTMGTLSLARDNELPRVVFNDISHTVALCPFVRLDHTTSSALLSRFSYSLLDASSAMHTLTPSL